MPTTVTVYVPCYNGERTLIHCLSGLLAQTRLADEIIVVDDGSTDRSARIAKRYGVKCIRHSENKGLSAARNSGVRFASGELVAAIDADCMADPHWLETLVKLMDANPGLCGAAGAVMETERTSMADRWRCDHMKQNLGEKLVRNPKFLFGANTIFRKDVLTRAGRYPPALRTNGEDHEICMRIYQKIPNAQLIYIPSAVVHHLRRDSLLSLLDNFWRYQCYASWMAMPAMPLPDRLFQLRRMLQAIWCHHLPKDIRARRWGGLVVALAAVPYLTWRQLRQYARSRAATTAKAGEDR